MVLKSQGGFLMRKEYVGPCLLWGCSVQKTAQVEQLEEYTLILEEHLSWPLEVISTTKI